MVNTTIDIRETKLDRMVGGPSRILPFSYPPPSYEVGIIDGQPYQLTQCGQWHPYGEIEKCFFEDFEN